jgi:predicted nucleotidyltransferase component of viral defense system
MNPIFWNTITEEMRSMMSVFSTSAIAQHFYLAGGTALALQLGHRRSIDLDFFSPTQDIPAIRSQLEKALAPLHAILADSSWGNLVYLAKNVRIGFYGYGYPLVADTIQAEGISMASIQDIALMKMDALLARAARKDFYDLYFICQTHSLPTLFEMGAQKYLSVRDFETQVTKRLVFFDSAENDPDPVLLHPVNWQDVKEYFISQAKAIEQSWLR